jgi:hypothetical protein
MTRIILDAGLRQKLNNLREPLELCDESGRVLGRFTPALELCDESGRVLGQLYPPLESSPTNGTEPHLSEEELQRREQEPEYSTAEVLAYLEKL